MRNWLKSGAGGVLMVLGLAGLGMPAAGAEIRYEGGWVVVPSGSRTSNFAPRYDGHAPMRFYGPRSTYPPPSSDSSGIGSYRFYSFRSSDYPPRPGTATARPAPAPEVPAPASETPYGVPPDAHPWNQAGFEGYDESVSAVSEPPLGDAGKYSLEATALSHRVPDHHGNIVVLMAYLPEDAALWVEGVLTRAKGQTRYFESPPLPPGKKYRYAVRAVWREDGKWVSQTREIPVQAGQIHGVYLTASPATLVKRKEARVEANLAKLTPDDQKVARQQKICVVREDARLGEQGVPVKVMVKNRRVFVCAPDCVQKVLAEPDQSLAKALALRAKNAPPPGVAPGK